MYVVPTLWERPPAGHARLVHFRAPCPRKPLRAARHSCPPPPLPFTNAALIFSFNFLQLRKTMECCIKGLREGADSSHQQKQKSFILVQQYLDNSSSFNALTTEVIFAFRFSFSRKSKKSCSGESTSRGIQVRWHLKIDKLSLTHITTQGHTIYWKYNFSQSHMFSLVYPLTRHIDATAKPRVLCWIATAHIMWQSRNNKEMMHTKT